VILPEPDPAAIERDNEVRAIVLLKARWLLERGAELDKVLVWCIGMGMAGEAVGPKLLAEILDEHDDDELLDYL
jgi:hypothetical protein